MLKIVPNKTANEVRLNKFYFQFIESYQMIPKKIIERFKSDVEKVKRENPLYSNKK